MECDICLCSWNLDIHIPKVLNCGHTCCLQCLIEIYNSTNLRKQEFCCPTCRYSLKQHISCIEDIKNLVNNHSLMSIILKFDKRLEFTNTFKCKIYK